MSDDYRIEESDDPRTWGDELVSDCEAKEQQPKEEPKEEGIVSILEYLGELKNLIDACGNVSYFWNMKRYVKADVNKAKIIAAAYQRNLRYYEDQCNEWRVKAERSFIVLKALAEKFGYEKPDRKDFLNKLTLYKDRRDAYKVYLRTCLKNKTPISFEELEDKYEKRLLKRTNGTNGTSKRAKKGGKRQ